MTNYFSLFTQKIKIPLFSEQLKVLKIILNDFRSVHLKIQILASWKLTFCMYRKNTTPLKSQLTTTT